MMPLGSMMKPDLRLRFGLGCVGAAGSGVPCCTGASGKRVLKIFTTAGNNFGTSSSSPRAGSSAIAEAIKADIADPETATPNIATRSMASRDTSSPPRDRHGMHLAVQHLAPDESEETCCHAGFFIFRT